MRWSYAISTAARLAFDSLRAHKLRSFLTLLGVIIGVSSVVIVGAAIEGLGNYAEESTSKVFGSDSFQIGQLLQRGRLSRRQLIDKLKSNHPIRNEDLAYLRLTTGESVLYSPYRFRSEDLRSASTLLEASTIIGVSADMADIREVTLTDGRFFTTQEERNKIQSTVIGEDVRQAFFPATSPIGKSIKIAGFDFTVVGVQEKIGNAGGQSQDNVAFIPATVFHRIYGPDRTMLLFARAARMDPVEALRAD